MAIVASILIPSFYHAIERQMPTGLAAWIVALDVSATKKDTTSKLWMVIEKKSNEGVIEEEGAWIALLMFFVNDMFHHTIKFYM